MCRQRLRGGKHGIDSGTCMYSHGAGRGVSGMAGGGGQAEMKLEKAARTGRPRWSRKGICTGCCPHREPLECRQGSVVMISVFLKDRCATMERTKQGRNSERVQRAPVGSHCAARTEARDPVVFNSWPR